MASTSWPDMDPDPDAKLLSSAEHSGFGRPKAIGEGEV
jgi:hypothetical protein